MKQEIAQLWSKALRSGDYKQCNGQLRKGDSYCCLGVLSEISGLSKWIAKNYNNFSYDSDNYVLPYSVSEWAEMKNKEGEFTDDKGNDNSLILFNDGRKKIKDRAEIKKHSFNEIADIIDEHWQAL